ncbi:MAG: hypothetical protein P8X85_00215 [Desulfobacterales bacterium]
MTNFIKQTKFASSWSVVNIESAEAFDFLPGLRSILGKAAIGRDVKIIRKWV